jgi:hypothetical protein
MAVCQVFAPINVGPTNLLDFMEKLDIKSS